MTAPYPDQKALAAGLVTATLTPDESAQAEALLLTDAGFAELVRAFREIFDAEDDKALPERVWLDGQVELMS
jgi:anti-sigma-K factor RskA